jgi:hypothetical protein
MKEFKKWFNKNHPLPATIERGPVGRDFKKGCKQSWKASREELLKEIDKRFVNIIKLCDHPMYDKNNIKQVANNACSFIYLLQKELKNE